MYVSVFVVNSPRLLGKNAAEKKHSILSDRDSVRIFLCVFACARSGVRVCMCGSVYDECMGACVCLFE